MANAGSSKICDHPGDTNYRGEASTVLTKSKQDGKKKSGARPSGAERSYHMRTPMPLAYLFRQHSFDTRSNHSLILLTAS